METTQSLEFRTGQVSKILGVPVRTISSWVHLDIVRPSKRGGAGPGRYRLFGFGDLIRMRLFLRLRALGVSPRTILWNLSVLEGWETYDWDALPPPENAKKDAVFPFLSNTLNWGECDELDFFTPLIGWTIEIAKFSEAAQQNECCVFINFDSMKRQVLRKVEKLQEASP